MVSRRNIRVKVMQCLYTLESVSSDIQTGEAVNLLKEQIEQTRQLFLYLVFFLSEVALYAEENFINWDDDAEMMNVLVLNFLHKPDHYDFGEIINAEKWDFAKNLLETTIEKKDLSMELLKPKLKNWDADRIAALDLIIIQM